MNKLIWTIFFMFGAIPIYSQKDSMSYYMNDNGLTDYRNIIKFDFSQLLQGNAMFTWEHDVSDNFRMEYGIGLLTSTFCKPIFNVYYRQGPDLFDEVKVPTNMKPGVSLYLSPRFLDIKYPAYYVSFNSLLQYYPGQLVTEEVSLTFGKSYNITNKIILDFQAGFGIDTHWSLDNYYYVHNIMLLKGKGLNHPNVLALYFPVSIKLGYRIN